MYNFVHLIILLESRPPLCFLQKPFSLFGLNNPDDNDSVPASADHHDDDNDDDDDGAVAAAAAGR